MITTFVVFDGPERSGKSTTINTLCSFMRKHEVLATEDSFAAPVKHFISTALGAKFGNMPKESPVAVLSGRTVNEFKHLMMEQMREEYGFDFFGRMLANRVLRLMPKPVFAFVESTDNDLDVIAGAVVVRVERPGKGFVGGRDYLPAHKYKLENNGRLGDLWVEIETLGQQLLKLV